ncbi:hypothetical protein C7M61_004273 [Candidozyma pseudohaemuli]|uniref:Rdx family-domain-containing protein n=1 Tax=Candidozyma pseudohaemuli TaxID=418784 RepID=A0A2P7YIJ9_9ASCO|nr:hypothetical protein C7M61_004273 [[Candida] pseudohaemulonii]PSK35791.1 hypothetical protein C7M61_004273 [[Candida] pseudohaemulonii]
MPSPKVSIYYCARCKWQNRAVWYLQEILQTFSDPEKNLIPEVAVCPSYDQPGLFEITVTDKEGEKTVYKRRMKKLTESQSEPYFYDGFPDSKLLKVILRNALFPEAGLGHAESVNPKEPGLMLTCEKCNVEES